MTASATTLALMLTLLSMGAGVEQRLRESHYRRIKHIALADASVFVGATLFLLMLNVPLEASSGSTEVPVRLYDTVYHATLVVSSLLGGTLVAIVMMIYSAVTDMVYVLSSPTESWLTINENSDESSGDASKSGEAHTDDAEEAASEGPTSDAEPETTSEDDEAEEERAAWAERRRRASAIGIRSND
jgi:hypothetical protein